MRNNTKKVKIGNIAIGGDSPISVQAMTNTDTRDAEATIKQIKRLEEAGCEIVKVAVPNNCGSPQRLLGREPHMS